MSSVGRDIVYARSGRPSVTDEGCGIATDKLTKICEPVYSTKRNEGTGLGLSTIYGIVKQTGGYIFVQSAECQGPNLI